MCGVKHVVIQMDNKCNLESGVPTYKCNFAADSSTCINVYINVCLL